MVPPNAPTKKIFLSDRPEEEKKVDPQLAPEMTPTAPPPHPVPQSPEEAAAQKTKRTATTINTMEKERGVLTKKTWSF